MKARKKKRRKRIKRIFPALVLPAVPGLSVPLYGPVKTPASPEKMNDFTLFVMRYQGTYLFDLFVEAGSYQMVYRKIYDKIKAG